MMFLNTLRLRIGLLFVVFIALFLTLISVFGNILVISIILAVVFGLIFGSLIAYIVTEPISEIEAMARKAASGDFSDSFKAEAKGDFAGLAKSFNQLVDGCRRLIQITQLLSKEHDLDRLLNLIISESKRLMDAERATLFLYNNETQELWSYIVSELEIKEIRLQRGKGVAGHVAKTGSLLNISDPYNDPRFSKETDKATGFVTRNILCAPMFDQKNGLLGVIQVLNKTGGEFTEHDEALLTAIAAQAAIAIENTRLYASRENLFRSLIRTIVATIDARDPVTSGHSERVARYSVALGKALGLPQDDMTILEHSALLHDVGKIGIRDEILTKPGKYTPEEYEAVKRHPAISREILEKAYFTGSQKQIPFLAGSHHEKLDGTGYPAGLKNGEIPLISRIITVSDVYDALVSYDRPYKPALSVEKAISILREESGQGKYDPSLVETFINNKLYELELRQKVKISDTLAIEYRVLTQDECRAILPLVERSKDSGKTGLVFPAEESLPLNGFLEVRLHKPGFTIDVLTRVTDKQEKSGLFETSISFVNISAEGVKNLGNEIVDLTDHKAS